MSKSDRGARMSDGDFAVGHSTFQYCEAELFDYHFSKARLADLQADILQGAALTDTGRVSHAPSDTVQSRAFRLVTERELVRLTRITQAIEQVYAQLPGEYRDLIRWRYWNGHPIEWRPNPADVTGKQRLSRVGISQKLNIGATTYDRRRREIIALLAYRLGI